jgi:DNA-binding transcriptional LysR family regulator
MSIRLPSFPNLCIQTTGQLFSTELVRGVIAGELNIALVTRPPHDAQITAVPFDRAPLYAVLPVSHAAAHKDMASLHDLAHDDWILFGPRAHPLVHDEIVNAAKRLGITPRRSHYILDAQQAIHFVSRGVGVAILSKPTALGHRIEGVVAKPLLDKCLSLETSVVIRADDRSLIVNQLVRAFLRRHARGPVPSQQMDLPLPA